MNRLTKAESCEIKIEGNKRSIQLFDVDGNEVDGEKAYWVGDFDCSYNDLTSLKGSPSKVIGDFDCYSNDLTSLKGSPTEVIGNFDCSYNNLKSLEGYPKEVRGNFDCSSNNLTSPNGAPTWVIGDFDCSYNNLNSLKGSPTEVGGSFYCAYTKLTTLEGAPKEVGGGFYCNNDNLKSLKGAPTEVGGDFYCYSSNLNSLEGAPEEVGGNFCCYSNNLNSLEEAPKMGNIVSYLARGYVFADGILQKHISTKQINDITVYYTKKIGSSEKQFVVTRDNQSFSHGDTIKKSVEDLQYKISDRDTSMYKDWKPQMVITKIEAIQAYRKITGACIAGVKDFIKDKNIPDTLDLQYIIDITKGHYGHNTFKSFIENDEKMGK